MPQAWFHVIWSTHGSWLPGDPRGFRSHDHRIHSSGTYDNPPPPGEHRLLHDHARRSLTVPPVILDPPARRLVLETILAKADQSDIPLVALAIAGTHGHILAKLDPDRIGVQIGMLKRSSSHHLRDRYPGTVWSKRCHPRRIKTIEHQRKAIRYIADHAHAEQAAIWTYLDTQRPR